MKIASGERRGNAPLRWYSGRAIAKPQIGWHMGIPVHGAFKLDHLHPIKPLLFWKFSIFFTFLLGSQFQRANNEKRPTHCGSSLLSPPPATHRGRVRSPENAEAKFAPAFHRGKASLAVLLRLLLLHPFARSPRKACARKRKGGLQRVPLRVSKFRMTQSQASRHELIFYSKCLILFALLQ